MNYQYLQVPVQRHHDDRLYHVATLVLSLFCNSNMLAKAPLFCSALSPLFDEAENECERDLGRQPWHI